MARRKLEIEILDSRRGSGFKDSERAASSWGKKLAGFGRTAALGLVGVAVGAGAMGLSFVKAAEESAKVTKQTSAVLKSMGDVAGVTATEVADLSEKLAMKTGVDDELIQSGQNVLLTFGKVRNEVGLGNDIFSRATVSALDMSVALGTDLSAANIQLGKALNDPIKGITALSRAGVSFTAEQKEQIKTLVEHGDVLGAQKVILGELEKQFAGSAEAQATASEKLNVVWGNLQETLGEKLLPVAEAFSAWMIEEGVPWIEDRLVPAIEDDLVPAIGSIAKDVDEKLMPALRDVGSFFADNPWAIKGVLALAGLATGISIIASVIGFLLPVLKALGVLVGFVGFAVVGLGNIFLFTLGIIAAPFILLGFLVAKTWDSIKSGAIAVKDWVVDHWPLLFQVFAGPIGLAVGFIVDNFNGVVEFVKKLPGRITAAAKGIWNSIFGGLSGLVDNALRLLDKLPGIDINRGGGFVSGPGILRAPPTRGPVRAMAAGGVVRRRPGGILANLGEGRHDEAVVPLDGRLGLGTTINLTVNVAGSVNGVDDLYGTISTGLENGRINVRGRRL